MDNKPGRVAAITAFVRGTIEKRMFSSLELDSLRGKLQYAEFRTFGRLARFALFPNSGILQRSCQIYGVCYR